MAAFVRPETGMNRFEAVQLDHVTRTYRRDDLEVRAEVDINESDIAKTFLGMPAVVVADAYPQAHFKATVVKIYPEADR